MNYFLLFCHYKNLDFSHLTALRLISDFHLIFVRLIPGSITLHFLKRRTRTENTLSSTMLRKLMSCVCNIS